MQIQRLAPILLVLFSFGAMANEALPLVERIQLEQSSVELKPSKLIPFVFAGIMVFPDVGREVNGERESALSISWAGGDWSLGKGYSVGFAGVWVDAAGDPPEYVESRPYFGFSVFSVGHRLELALATEDALETHYYEFYQLWSTSLAGGMFKFEPYISYDPSHGLMNLAWSDAEWFAPSVIGGVNMGVASFAKLASRWSESEAVIGPSAQFVFRDLFKAMTVVGVDVFEVSKPVAWKIQVKGGF